MKSLRQSVLAAIVAIACFAQAQSAKQAGGDRERLIGAWHLVHIDAPEADGKPGNIAQPKGTLIYTRDGHMSVELMYPKSAHVSNNEYVRDGYEASFGTYEVNEATHTLTHHVEGSITRNLLVGKQLSRVYHFTADGRLIIKSARTDEHWSVTWEHY